MNAMDIDSEIIQMEDDDNVCGGIKWKIYIYRRNNGTIWHDIPNQRPLGEGCGNLLPRLEVLLFLVQTIALDIKNYLINPNWLLKVQNKWGQTPVSQKNDFRCSQHCSWHTFSDFFPSVTFNSCLFVVLICKQSFFVVLSPIIFIAQNKIIYRFAIRTCM